jgi:excisionase family DNA binding protein
MAEEKLLTVRDVSMILDISEREVVNLAESGKIPAYKVGGVFLRFKREQILEFKKTHKAPSVKPDASLQYTLRNRVRDFLHFNDFYILALLLIAFLLILILRGY